MADELRVSPPVPPKSPHFLSEEDDDDDNAPATVFEANRVAPIWRPFVWFANAVYGSTLRRGDSFVLRARKGTITLQAIAALLVISNIVDLAATTKSTPYLPIVGNIIGIVKHLGISVPTYLYCITTRSAPDWLITLQITCDLILNLACIIQFRGLHSFSATIAYSVIAVAARARFSNALVFLGIMSVVVDNVNYMPNSPFLLPGALPQYSSIPAIIIGEAVALLFLALWVRLVIERFDHMYGVTRRSVEISFRIATLIRDYDTDAVQTVLDEYRQTDDRDARLISAFQEINDNLRKYRPHLPNYVLARDDDDDDRSYLPFARQVAVDDNTDSVLSPLDASVRTTSMRERGASIADRLSSPDGGVGQAAQQQPQQLGRSGTAPSQRAEGPFFAGGDSSRRQQRLFSSHSLRGDRANGIPPLKSFGDFEMTPSSTNVVVARPSAMFGPSPPPPDRASSSSEMLLSRCVTNVHIAAMAVDVEWRRRAGMAPDPESFNELIVLISDVANATHASLHSVVGDRILMTWNAPRRAAKVETKACAFMDRLRQGVGRGSGALSDVKLSGMVACGPAASMLAGNSHTKVFVCSAPRVWEMVTAGLHATRHLHVMAMDHATQVFAAMDFETRGLAIVDACNNNNNDDMGINCSTPFDAARQQQRATANAGGRLARPIEEEEALSRCVYELLRERQVEVRDMEWMYVLQQQQNDGPNEMVTKALRMIATGFEDARIPIALIDVALQHATDLGGSIEGLRELRSKAVRARTT